eukprot:scaffold41018_cov146-Skeletonema_marinoi.AAC.5
MAGAQPRLGPDEVRFSHVTPFPFPLEIEGRDLDKGGPSSGKIACALFSPTYYEDTHAVITCLGEFLGAIGKDPPPAPSACTLHAHLDFISSLEVPAMITMMYSSCDIVTLLLAVSSASIIINSASATTTSSAFQLLPTKRTWNAPPTSSSLHRRFHTDSSSSSSRPLSSVILPLESVQIASRRIVAATELYASKNEENVDNNNNIDEESNNNDGDDDSYISKRYPNTHQTSWAYSGLTNAWGYSARLVTKRERRRYERRRIRHRRRVEAKSYSDGGGNNSGSGSSGKRRLNTWVSRMVEDDIITGAGDAFVGNVKKNKGADVANTDDNTNFDDDEMDEDGYWNMLGKKKRSILKRLLRIPYRALFGEYRTVEPGTLILVRHGE